MRTRTIAGKEYQLVVLHVTASDEHGRPKTCDIGFDDTVFQIKDGEEFVTAWIPVAPARKRS